MLTESGPSIALPVCRFKGWCCEMEDATQEVRHCGVFSGLIGRSAGSTVKVSGSIVDLDKDFVGNCPGGGHAKLKLWETYKEKSLSLN
jgi:hypothetical protein